MASFSKFDRRDDPQRQLASVERILHFVFSTFKIIFRLVMMSTMMLKKLPEALDVLQKVVYKYNITTQGFIFTSFAVMYRAVCAYTEIKGRAAVRFSNGAFHASYLCQLGSVDRR